MKTSEKALAEWVKDSIRFEGRYFNKFEMTELHKAFVNQNPGYLVTKSPGKSGGSSASLLVDWKTATVCSAMAKSMSIQIQIENLIRYASFKELYWELRRKSEKLSPKLLQMRIDILKDGLRRKRARIKP